MALFTALFILYWLPTLIAIFRASPNAMAIAALNFLLGWTGLGWIAALVWSLSASHRPQGVIVRVEKNHIIADKEARIIEKPVPRQISQ